MTKKIKILCVVGARPNFVKIVPIMEAMRRYCQFRPVLVHTGQHYDKNLSDVFFQDLKIPQPDYNLGVGSGTHAQQTAKIIQRLEPVILKERPDLVIVVGDVNSTLAAALTASKIGIKLAHVEAGLRSFDRTMPEEINRIVVDHLSDFLFTTCQEANQNLKKEGIDVGKIFFVGNVMIDNLKECKVQSAKCKVLNNLKLRKQNYVLLTMHRPSNVDDKKTFSQILAALIELQKQIKIVWPIHPRALKNLQSFKLKQTLSKAGNLILTNPLGYLDFLSLEAKAKLVLTDSGGVQEETTFLRVPCLTIRPNTERPITITQGTNQLVMPQKDKILKAAFKILKGNVKKCRPIRYWDGQAAKRVVKILNSLF